MSARTHPVQTIAELRAERHARTFTQSQIPHCPHVQRLSEQGFNPHQIAMQTRRPIIDVRLILAGIEEAKARAEKEARKAAHRRRA